MSFKAEFQADSSGTWAGNALRFRPAQEARDYAVQLAWRWTSVRDWRIVECHEPVTHVHSGDRAVPLDRPEEDNGL